jgi:Protein of unknown function (DUF3522).
MSLHSKYGYNFGEQCLMMLITGITNAFTIPVILLMYRKNIIHRAFFGFFTGFTSFMYHTLESLDINRVFLDEGQWHRLDNVGSIICFCSLFVFLMDNRDDILDLKLEYIAVFISLVAQEKDPWNINYTVIPIMCYVLMFIGVLLWRKRKPKYNMRMLKKGVIYLSFAIPCFVFALNEHSDYLRFFHGLWHLFIGMGSFYIWQAKHQICDEIEVMEILFPTPATYEKLRGSSKHFD